MYRWDRWAVCGVAMYRWVVCGVAMYKLRKTYPQDIPLLCLLRGCDHRRQDLLRQFPKASNLSHRGPRPVAGERHASSYSPTGVLLLCRDTCVSSICDHLFYMEQPFYI